MTVIRHIANGLAVYMLVFIAAGGIMYLSARSGLGDDIALFIFGALLAFLARFIRDRERN